MQPAADRLRGFFARHGSLVPLLGLAALLAALYWPAASLQGVFYVGDILRLNYPARAVYARGLQSGHIPLWTPDALGGYPLLAEGQTGAYYPLNLLLYRWLPLGAALNYSVLFSFWIAGAGLYAYARTLGLRRGAALLAACVFMLGGFLPAHLTHLNMLAAAAWLPWLLWAVERATRSARGRDWALAAAFFGLQGLAGHPQVLYLSAVPVAALALVGPLAPPHPRRSLLRRLGQLGLCCGALAGGAALAAAQLLPTYELMGLSQRGQPLTYEFFTSFSVPPGDLIRLLRPFNGNPYPAVSQEVVGYVGILPLALAALAPLRRPNRAVAFWLLLAVVGLSLALGHFNSAYHLLWHLPLVNRFRVPARYLLWLDLGIAVLAAIAADALLARATDRPVRRRLLVPGVALPLATLGALWSAWTPLERLLAQWRWLPLAWLAGAVGLLVALLWRPPARLWLALALGLVLADLGAFVGVHNRTYNAVTPPAALAATPDAVRFLQADAGAGLYRVYTDERSQPDIPTMPEALYPNTALLYGVQSANGYYPLVPDPQEWLRQSYTPRLLDLLNVRYVLVPQVRPAEGPAELCVAEDPFARSLTGRAFGMAAQPVVGLQAEGFTLRLPGLPTGTPLAEVVLHSTGGEEVTWTLRAGLDLASWDEARPAPPLTVARTWVARFDGTPADGLGRTFLARYDLAQPLQAVSVQVRPLVAADRLRLERLRLVGPGGEARTLPVAAGGGDHVLAYCSPGVAIYRNGGAGPRAFLAPRARTVQGDEQACAIMAAASFDPYRELLVLGGPMLAGEPSPGDEATVEAYGPEYVRVRATTASRAYLVLADSAYPSWRARVDGEGVPIVRADVALRAVLLEPGEHVVEFSFAPSSWRAALFASAAGWAALAAFVLWRR